MKFFLAHSKSKDNDDASLVAFARELEARLYAMQGPKDMPRPRPTVTAGITDHEAHFAACGSWDAWIARWAYGADDNGAQHYDAIIVIDLTVRRAVGNGVELALRVGKPVYWVDVKTGDFYQVIGLRQTGGNRRWPIYGLVFEQAGKGAQ